MSGADRDDVLAIYTIGIVLLGIGRLKRLFEQQNEDGEPADDSSATIPIE